MPELTDVVFPILMFYKGYCVEAHYGTKLLTRLNGRGLKNKPFENSFLIDSTGNRFSVLQVNKLGVAKPYFFIFLFDPYYRLGFILDEPERLSVETVKDIVITNRRKEKKRSQRFYRLVSKASTYIEIIHAVDEAIYGPGGDYPSEDEC